MEKKSNKKIIFLIVLFIGLLLSLGILLFLYVFNKDDNYNKNNNDDVKQLENVVKVNTNESINEVKNLNGLTFESTKIVYKNGLSTLTTKVTNNNDYDYTKEIFNIIIKDKNNNIIKNNKDDIILVGSITGGLKSKESRNIVSVIDVDLSSNVYYIEYKEVE